MAFKFISLRKKILRFTMRLLNLLAGIFLKNKDIRDFMFRGLMFESEATEFQRAGIQIGADRSAAEDSLLADSLAPFGVAKRNSALEVARLYVLLFFFEKENLDWYEKIPPKILSYADGRKKGAMKGSWLEDEKTDLLGFVDFGSLVK